MKGQLEVETKGRTVLNAFGVLMPSIIVAAGAGLFREEEGFLFVCLIIQSVVNIYSFIRGVRKEPILLCLVTLSAIPLLIGAGWYRNRHVGPIALVALVSFFVPYLTLVVKIAIRNFRANKAKTSVSDSSKILMENGAMNKRNDIHGETQVEKSPLETTGEVSTAGAVKQMQTLLPADYRSIVGGVELVANSRAELIAAIKKTIDEASVLSYTIAKLPAGKEAEEKVLGLVRKSVEKMSFPLLPRNLYLKFRWPVSHVSRMVSEVMEQMRVEVLKCNASFADELIVRKLRPDEVSKLQDSILASVKDIVDASNANGDSTLTVPDDNYYK